MEITSQVLTFVRKIFKKDLPMGLGSSVYRRPIFTLHLCKREEDCNHQTRWYLGLNHSISFITIVLFWILFHFLYSTLIIGLET